MTRRHFTSLSEQVAQEIKDGLEQCRWTDKMPGRKALATELGVNHKTCESALRLLEVEGLLVTQGKGLGRMIVKSEKANPKSATIRVRVLLYEKSAVQSHYMVELLYMLREAEYDAAFAEKTMRGLGMDTGRITRYVENIDADAWIVLAGSRDVMDWFASRRVPVFALFGRMSKLPIACIAPSKMDAMRELVGRLVDLGHRRIVLLNREDRRKPTLGIFEELFFECLEEHGIETSSYNMPDWGDHPDELERVLKSLFGHTPPTAMIVDEVSVFFSVVQQLARLGIAAPDQISLACMDYSHVFDWSRPQITHIRWDTDPLIKRVVKWVEHVSDGKQDFQKSSIKATLHVGGTIGPVPK